MPVDVKIKVTCDLCGESAQRYPSFFDLLDDDTYGPYESVPDMPGLCRKVAPVPRISTRGCLRPGLSVCLCETHFAAVTAALELWLAEITVASR